MFDAQPLNLYSYIDLYTSAAMEQLQAARRPLLHGWRYNLLMAWPA
eukprot:COSAG02_NODE_58706_length_276_cov_1.056497_1_plen_45_part_10